MTELDDLAQKFATNVVAQTDAMRRGDSKTGNKHAKQYVQAFKALRAHGDPGRDALVPFMREGREDVRAMAAAFLLRHRPVEALQVLRKLASGKGIVALEASETLKRWADGSWQLDPP